MRGGRGLLTLRSPSAQHCTIKWVISHHKLIQGSVLGSFPFKVPKTELGTSLYLLHHYCLSNNPILLSYMEQNCLLAFFYPSPPCLSTVPQVSLLPLKQIFQLVSLHSDREIWKMREKFLWMIAWKYHVQPYNPNLNMIITFYLLFFSIYFTKSLFLPWQMSTSSVLGWKSFSYEGKKRKKYYSKI